MQKEQIQQPDTDSEDPKVQMKMFRTSRLQKIVKVLQVHVINVVAKVTRSMRRQVSMTQDETERGRIRSPRRCRSVSVLTSQAQVGQSADNDPRFTMNSRERQPRR